MATRWAGALLVLGVARAAVAAEPPVAPVAPMAPVVPVVATEATDLASPGGRALAAPVAGALTILVPLAVGGALWANSARDDLQRAGTFVMASGFALAPWVSHGITGRWRRAAAFGSISAATSLATVVALEVKDPFDSGYKNYQRIPFGMLLTSAFFAAAAGVVDSMLVGPAPSETP
jgi:hypothetical protein